MVPWYEVEDYMHLEGVDESELSGSIAEEEYGTGNARTATGGEFSSVSRTEGQGRNRNSPDQADSGYRPPKNAGVGSYEDEE